MLDTDLGSAPQTLPVPLPTIAFSPGVRDREIRVLPKHGDLRGETGAQISSAFILSIV